MSSHQTNCTNVLFKDTLNVNPLVIAEWCYCYVMKWGIRTGKLILVEKHFLWFDTNAFGGDYKLLLIINNVYSDGRSYLQNYISLSRLLLF